VKRHAFPCLVLLSCLTLAPAAFAQTKKAVAGAPAKADAKPAVSTAPAPISEELMKARMRPPVKGTAYLEVIPGASKKVGDEIVTVTKVKNTSDAPIVGLRVDEWWYAKGQQVSGGDFKLRYPLAPGEIAELTTKSPVKPDMSGGSQLQFTHANGQVRTTRVKKFSDDKKADAKKK
jgi:hypothetical protein